MVLDVPEPADPRQSATRGLLISCACSRISLPSPPAGGDRLSEIGDRPGGLAAPCPRRPAEPRPPAGGPSPPARGKNLRHVTHLAAGARSTLAIKVDARPGYREPAGVVLDLGADQIRHFDPSVPQRLGQRPTDDRAHMLL